MTWTRPLSRGPACDISNWFESQYFLGRSNITTGWHRFSGPEMLSTQQPEAMGSCSALCCGCQTFLPKTRVCSVLFSQPQVFWPASFPFSFLPKKNNRKKRHTDNSDLMAAQVLFFWGGGLVHHISFYDLFLFNESPGAGSWGVGGWWVFNNRCAQNKQISSMLVFRRILKKKET